LYHFANKGHTHIHGNILEAIHKINERLVPLDIRHKQSSAKAADDFFLKIFQWREENFRAPSGSGP